jgi:hypothetical protein
MFEKQKRPQKLLSVRAKHTLNADDVDELAEPGCHALFDTGIVLPAAPAIRDIACQALQKVAAGRQDAARLAPGKTCRDAEMNLRRRRPSTTA